MVSLPRLKQSMCGCTLETSSMIIAWLGVLGVAFQILLGTCLFGVFYDYVHEEMIHKSIPEERIDATMLAIKIVAAILFVIYFASLTIDTMLLVGIYKRNYCLMTPWIIFSGIGCAMGMISVVITVLSAFTDASLLFAGFFQGLLVALSIYCYLLVYSYYAQIKEERSMNDARFKPLGA